MNEIYKIKGYGPDPRDKRLLQLDKESQGYTDEKTWTIYTRISCSYQNDIVEIGIKHLSFSLDIKGYNFHL